LLQLKFCQRFFERTKQINEGTANGGAPGPTTGEFAFEVCPDSSRPGKTVKNHQYARLIRDGVQIVHLDHVFGAFNIDERVAHGFLQRLDKFIQIFLAKAKIIQAINLAEIRHS
jgi:hypothetical protein